MTPRDFALLCRDEKDLLLRTYFEGSSETAVSTKIREMNLNPAQLEQLQSIADGMLTDCMYGFLLGLDGAASIGGSQHSYQLRDDQGNLLTNGELENHACDVFHNRA